MSWLPERFVDTILGPLNPALVVVGQNFTFGREAAGTPQVLADLGTDRFEVVVLPLIRVDAEQTCSTLIRQELARGAVANAARHLGRPL